MVLVEQGRFSKLDFGPLVSICTARAGFLVLDARLHVDHDHPCYALPGCRLL